MFRYVHTCMYALLLCLDFHPIVGNGMYIHMYEVKIYVHRVKQVVWLLEAFGVPVMQWWMVDCGTHMHMYVHVCV